MVMPMPGGGTMPAPGAPIMARPPGGTGPATSPMPMAGSGAQAVTGVKLALEAMQKALPGIQMGSKLHLAVMKAITDISKELDAHEGDQSAIVQQLAQLARSAQQQPQAAAMMRAFPTQPPAEAAAPPMAA